MRQACFPDELILVAEVAEASLSLFRRFLPRFGAHAISLALRLGKTLQDQSTLVSLHKLKLWTGRDTWLDFCRIGKFKRILALEEADQEGFEEEGFFFHQRKRGDPKSRAQQQLRELEGKERLERSRVERRLKLTQSARQGTLRVYNLHMSISLQII